MKKGVPKQFILKIINLNNIYSTRKFVPIQIQTLI